MQNANSPEVANFQNSIFSTLQNATLCTVAPGAHAPLRPLPAATGYSNATV